MDGHTFAVWTIIVSHPAFFVKMFLRKIIPGRYKNRPGFLLSIPSPVIAKAESPRQSHLRPFTSEISTSAFRSPSERHGRSVGAITDRPLVGHQPRQKQRPRNGPLFVFNRSHRQQADDHTAHSHAHPVGRQGAGNAAPALLFLQQQTEHHRFRQEDM